VPSSKEPRVVRAAERAGAHHQTSIPVRAAPAADHRYVGYLEDLVSRIATGDRAAFRLLYAFMAMRVWHAVTETPLGLIRHTGTVGASGQR
jgi:hypothetical protein